MNRSRYHASDQGRPARISALQIRRVQRQIEARRQLSAKAIARREGLSQAAVERIARGDLPKKFEAMRHG